MSYEMGTMLIGQQAAIKMMEKKFDGSILRTKPSFFKKMMKKMSK